MLNFNGRQGSPPASCHLHNLPSLPLPLQEAQVKSTFWDWSISPKIPPNLRLRNKRENYVGQLQKSIVDNVSNIYRILFVIAVSAVSTAFGLYHMWRLRKNSEKSSEKLNSTILPPGIFLLLAVFSFCALMPYFTSQALRWIHLVIILIKLVFLSLIRAFVKKRLASFPKMWSERVKEWKKKNGVQVHPANSAREDG